MKKPLTVTGITETTVRDADGKIVYDGADYELTHDEAKEYAKLFRAAPDLLEALQELVEKCLHSDGYKQKVDELYNAQQAIKKATE